MNYLQGIEPSQAELVVVLDLLRLCPEHMGKIFHGAHILIQDDGYFYNRWKQCQAQMRGSSHYKDNPLQRIPESVQYGIRGPWAHEILFGIIQGERGVKETFLQFEKTPHDGKPLNTLGHGRDWVEYTIKKENIGTCGSSPHTDRYPIHVMYQRSNCWSELPQQE